MRLIVVHNHYRPGGVRRVIELGVPHLLAGLRPHLREIILTGGELPDNAWWKRFTSLVSPIRATCCIDPSLSYIAEQKAAPQRISAALGAFLEKLLQKNTNQTQPTLVWAHNQGLGRNLILTRELERACHAAGATLVFHHHDWWFDNRWQRWPELRKTGFRSLDHIAQTIFSTKPGIRHVAINHADAAVLERHLPGRSAWLPNPASQRVTPRPAHISAAKRWIQRQVGQSAPVWLMPCRLLRRKNIAEALLLTRWLRPDAFLVTTGAVTSTEEEPYARRLSTAAKRAGWPLRLSVLQDRESNSPTVDELICASETILLTSLQEGFGLPYLEAAALRRPLIARSLPNIAPDLAGAGLKFPHSYREILVAPGLFDWQAETRRQNRLFRYWKQRLPAPYRPRAGDPILLAAPAPQPVPFSRLTLTAQLEVLAHPPAESWLTCAPFNPFLAQWRLLAAANKLRSTRWPSSADYWFGGKMFVKRFQDLIGSDSAKPLPTAASMAAETDFIRAKVESENLYPLTWTSET